jgi:metallo-beta-lactamase family protein
MKITFLGATENVTGSKFCVEHGRSKVLIDAGLYQERDLVHRNWEDFPIPPSSIDTILLTHAHIDHCGYLPKLVKAGFKGKIYCTAPTREITKIALLDSAKVQEEDAAYKLKRHQREGRKGPFPEVALYTQKDARAVFPLFRKINYQEPIGLSNDLTATFFNAGHILGSAMIELKVKTGSSESIYIFSGDIGRWHKPILNDPHIFSKADYVVMEATYGNRMHEDGDKALDKMAEIINTTVRRGGKVLIPAFAVNRTQEVMFNLDQLFDAKKIPNIPLYVDSPMAADVTEIFNMYPQDFDAESKEILENERSLFHYPNLTITKDQEESKAINRVKGPAIIVASSGMCTGGRIKHHIFHQISKPENTLLFTGFQAVGTLGRKLIEKPTEVRILGQMIPVRAQIEKINGFSAHADQKELLQWIAGINNPIKKVFIVHAEKSTAHEFAAVLSNKFKTEVVVPQYGDVHQGF